MSYYSGLPGGVSQRHIDDSKSEWEVILNSRRVGEFLDSSLSYDDALTYAIRMFGDGGFNSVEIEREIGREYQ